MPPRLAGNPRGLTDEQCAWLLGRSRELGSRKGKWAKILAEWLEKGWPLRMDGDAPASGSEQEQQEKNEKTLQKIEQTLKQREDPNRTKRSKARGMRGSRRDAGCRDAEREGPGRVRSLRQPRRRRHPFSLSFHHPQENTAAEKRRMMKALLDAHPDWSARRRLPPASAHTERAHRCNVRVTAAAFRAAARTLLAFFDSNVALMLTHYTYTHRYPSSTQPLKHAVPMIYAALGGKAALERELFGEPSYDRKDGESLRAALRKLQEEQGLDIATLPSMPFLKKLGAVDLAKDLHTYAEGTQKASEDGAGSWVQLARTWGLRPVRGTPRTAEQRTMSPAELRSAVDAFLEAEGGEDKERRVLSKNRIQQWSREEGSDLYYQVEKQGLRKARIASGGLGARAFGAWGLWAWGRLGACGIADLPPFSDLPF